ncbi:MAG: aminopeptidase P family protein [Verrucomicrobia bacterium]|nr:aminopeptidase P family protein [Verrucomicrobiota bacterium]MBS0637065.1 aminopeptidase P family protein [Verrucomicrobiota bacterium]
MSQKRIKKVQKAISEWGVDAFIVTDPVDLFYLTDVQMSLGTIVITKQKATLVVDNRYLEKCQQEASCPAVQLKPGVVASLLSKSKRIGFSQESTSYSQFSSLAAEVEGELVPLEYPMQKIRAVKEASEVRQIKRAIELCYQGFEFVKSRLTPGVTEELIAKQLQLFWLALGGEALSFDSIIAFGKNASMPHYRAASTALKPGDIVLVDIGVVVDGYASDMTRCFFFGKPDKRLEKIYDIVLDAQVKSIKAVKPAISCAKLYEVSKKVIDKAGYGDKYLHGLGHGIGLETHEYPTLRPTATKSMLEPGMCITVEPGIYLPNLGGVRIEDMILVTKDGHENLTSGYPKEKLIISP